jgi:prepilin-type N-terminal cleavage/methylation domain-containing protein
VHSKHHSQPRILRLPALRRWTVRAFTLFELILVLVLIGVIAAVAVPRIMDPGIAADTSIHDRMRIHLRYAQAQALGEGTAWGIRSRNGEYWLFRVGAVDTPVRIIGEQDLRIAAAQVPDFDVVFDRWGRPFSAATPVGNTTSAVSIAVADRTIDILADTGFIR